jgi:hypothetical protein
MLIVFLLACLTFTTSLPFAYWPLRGGVFRLVRTLRRERPESGTLTVAVTRASEDAVEPPMHTFRTAARTNDFHDVGFRPARLEVQTRTLISRGWGSEHVVRESNLPTDVPCGPGRLTITAFTQNGFVLTERGTVNDEVKVRSYR